MCPGVAAWIVREGAHSPRAEILSAPAREIESAQVDRGFETWTPSSTPTIDSGEAPSNDVRRKRRDTPEALMVGRRRGSSNLRCFREQPSANGCRVQERRLATMSSRSGKRLHICSGRDWDVRNRRGESHNQGHHGGLDVA